MNFKRGRAKNQRAGCLMCKNWKINGFGKNRKDFESMSSHKQRIFSQEALHSYYEELFAEELALEHEHDDFYLTASFSNDTMPYQYERRNTYEWAGYLAPVPKPREFVASF